MLIKKLIPILCISLLNAESLDEILNTAIKNNYKLKSYDYNINAKKYVIKQAKDEYLPNISLYSSYTKEKYKEKYQNITYKVNDRIFSYGINIEQTIFNAQIFKLIKDAKLKKEVTVMEREKFLLNLYQNVITTYFEVIANKTSLYYYKIKKENYKKILENILAKAKYKYATNTDVSQAKSNYSIAVNEYIKAISNYENSIRKLKLLLLTNKDIQINSSIKNNVDNIIKSLLKKYSFYKNALKNNPILKSALLYTKIAKNEINKRKTNKYPTITLDARYENENTKNTTPTKDHYSITLNFNLNLYNKKINDNILEAKELYLASLNDYKYQKNSLEIELNKNWDNLQNTLEIVKSDKEKIIQTKEYFLKAKESFKYKLISLTDYYTAENDYFNALINFENDKLNLIYYYINILSESNELKEKVKDLKLFLN